MGTVTRASNTRSVYSLQKPKASQKTEKQSPASEVKKQEQQPEPSSDGVISRTASGSKAEEQSVGQSIEEGQIDGKLSLNYDQTLEGLLDGEISAEDLKAFKGLLFQLESVSPQKRGKFLETLSLDLQSLNKKQGNSQAFKYLVRSFKSQHQELFHQVKKLGFEAKGVTFKGRAKSGANPSTQASSASVRAQKPVTKPPLSTRPEAVAPPSKVAPPAPPAPPASPLSNPYPAKIEAAISRYEALLSQYANTPVEEIPSEAIDQIMAADREITDLVKAYVKASQANPVLKRDFPIVQKLLAKINPIKAKAANVQKAQQLRSQTKEIEELRQLPDPGATKRNPALDTMVDDIADGMKQPYKKKNNRGKYFNIGRALARHKISIEDLRNYALTGKMSPSIAKAIKASRRSGDSMAVNAVQGISDMRMTVLRTQSHQLAEQAKELEASKANTKDPAQIAQLDKQLEAINQQITVLDNKFEDAKGIEKGIINNASSRRIATGQRKIGDAKTLEAKAMDMMATNPEKAQEYFEKASKLRQKGIDRLENEGQDLADKAKGKEGKRADSLRKKAVDVRIQAASAHREVAQTKISKIDEDSPDTPMPDELTETGGVQKNLKAAKDVYGHLPDSENPVLNSDNYQEAVQNYHEDRKSFYAKRSEARGFTEDVAEGNAPSAGAAADRAQYMAETKNAEGVVDKRIELLQSAKDKAEKPEDFSVDNRKKLGELHKKKGQLNREYLTESTQHNQSKLQETQALKDVERLQRERDELKAQIASTEDMIRNAQESKQESIRNAEESKQTDWGIAGAIGIPASRGTEGIMFSQAILDHMPGVLEAKKARLAELEGEDGNGGELAKATKTYTNRKAISEAYASSRSEASGSDKVDYNDTDAHEAMVDKSYKAAEAEYDEALALKDKEDKPLFKGVERDSLLEGAADISFEQAEFKTQAHQARQVKYHLADTLGEEKLVLTRTKNSLDLIPAGSNTINEGIEALNKRVQKLRKRMNELEDLRDSPMRRRPRAEINREIKALMRQELVTNARAETLQKLPAHVRGLSPEAYGQQVNSRLGELNDPSGPLVKTRSQESGNEYKRLTARHEVNKADSEEAFAQVEKGKAYRRELKARYAKPPLDGKGEPIRGKKKAAIIEARKDSMLQLQRSEIRSSGAVASTYTRYDSKKAIGLIEDSRKVVQEEVRPQQQKAFEELLDKKYQDQPPPDMSSFEKMKAEEKELDKALEEFKDKDPADLSPEERSELQRLQKAKAEIAEVKSVIKVADDLSSEVASSANKAREELYKGIEVEMHAGRYGTVDRLFELQQEATDDITLDEIKAPRQKEIDHVKRQFAQILVMNEVASGQLKAGTKEFEERLDDIYTMLQNSNDAAISDIIDLGSWVTGNSLENRMNEQTKGQLDQSLSTSRETIRNFDRGRAAFAYGLAKAQKEGRAFEFLGLALAGQSNRGGTPAIAKRLDDHFLKGFVPPDTKTTFAGQEFSYNDADGVDEYKDRPSSFILGVRGKKIDPMFSMHPGLKAFSNSQSFEPETFVKAMGGEEAKDKPVMTDDAIRAVGAYSDFAQEWGEEAATLAIVNTILETALFIAVPIPLGSVANVTGLARIGKAAAEIPGIVHMVNAAVRIRQAMPIATAFVTGAATAVGMGLATNYIDEWATEKFGPNSPFTKLIRIGSNMVDLGPPSRINSMAEYLPQLLMAEGMVAFNLALPKFIDDPETLQIVGLVSGALVSGTMAAYGAYGQLKDMEAKSQGQAESLSQLAHGDDPVKANELRIHLEEEFNNFNRKQEFGNKNNESITLKDFEAHQQNLKKILAEHGVDPQTSSVIIKNQQQDWAFEMARTGNEFGEDKMPDPEETKQLVDDAAQKLRQADPSLTSQEAYYMASDIVSKRYVGFAENLRINGTQDDLALADALEQNSLIATEHGGVSQLVHGFENIPAEMRSQVVEIIAESRANIGDDPQAYLLEVRDKLKNLEVNGKKLSDAEINGLYLHEVQHTIKERVDARIAEMGEEGNPPSEAEVKQMVAEEMQKFGLTMEDAENIMAKQAATDADLQAKAQIEAGKARTVDGDSTKVEDTTKVEGDDTRVEMDTSEVEGDSPKVDGETSKVEPETRTVEELAPKVQESFKNSHEEQVGKLKHQIEEVKAKKRRGNVESLERNIERAETHQKIATEKLDVLTKHTSPHVDEGVKSRFLSEVERRSNLPENNGKTRLEVMNDVLASDLDFLPLKMEVFADGGLADIPKNIDYAQTRQAYDANNNEIEVLRKQKETLLKTGGSPDEIANVNAQLNENLKLKFDLERGDLVITADGSKVQPFKEKNARAVQQIKEQIYTPEYRQKMEEARVKRDAVDKKADPHRYEELDTELGKLEAPGKKLDFLLNDESIAVNDGLKAEFIAEYQRRLNQPQNRAKIAAEPDYAFQIMRDIVSDNPHLYVHKGNKVPLEVLKQQGQFTKVIGVESLFKRNMTDKAKDYLRDNYGVGKKDSKAFMKLVNENPQFLDNLRLELANNGIDMIEPNSVVAGQNGVGWWSNQAEAKDFQGAMDEYALNPDYYKGGEVLRITVTPEQMDKIGMYKPSPFDGINFPRWVEADGVNAPMGRTGGGAPEGVAPKIPLSDAKLDVLGSKDAWQSAKAKRKLERAKAHYEIASQKLSEVVHHPHIEEPVKARFLNEVQRRSKLDEYRHKTRLEVMNDVLASDIGFLPLKMKVFSDGSLADIPPNIDYNKTRKAYAETNDEIANLKRQKEQLIAEKASNQQIAEVTAQLNEQLKLKIDLERGDLIITADNMEIRPYQAKNELAVQQIKEQIYTPELQARIKDLEADLAPMDKSHPDFKKLNDELLLLRSPGEKLDFLLKDQSIAINDGLKAQFISDLQQRMNLPENKGRFALEVMQEIVGDNPDLYVHKGNKVPLEVLQEQGAFTKVLNLKSMYKRNMNQKVKDFLSATHGIKDAKGFVKKIKADPEFLGRLEADLKEINISLFDAQSQIGGQNGVAWWAPSKDSNATTFLEVMDELALDANDYEGDGVLRVTVTPEEIFEIGITKPTPFDGINFKEWINAEQVDDPMGSTRDGGVPEVVVPPLSLAKAHKVELLI